MAKRFAKAVTVFCLLSFVFAGASGATTDEPQHIGKHLFRSYCAVCHGSGGNTIGPLARQMGVEPADLTSEKYQKKTTEELAKIISGYGRKDGSKMPVWSEALPESNINHIAAYISKLGQDDLRFTADLRRGRFVYQNTCTACHGPLGHGNGILAKLIKANMADFANKASMKAKSHGEIVKVITEGRGDYMPPWRGLLNDDEISDVAAFVESMGK